MKRTTKKGLGLVLALAMVLSLLPAAALAAPGGYSVWVQGVQITDSNKDDVLDDGGTVAFDPETATLTLNNADITGAPVPDLSNRTAGIYSKIALTLELVGGSTVTGTSASDSSDGVFVRDYSLIITGDGSLIATGGASASKESHGIFGNTVTVNSGTVIARGGDASGYSIGIFGYIGVTINGGTVTGIGGTSQDYESLGISTHASSDPITVNGGTVTAIGSDRGFDFAPDLSGYTDPAVTVNTAATAEGATAWNGTDALGGEDSTFKYVKIAPTAAYNVWVEGVQITDGNKDDVLDDGGTVKFAPETATLTLNNADITGAPVPDNANRTAGIYSKIDLTLKLVGDNTVTGTSASSSSDGVFVREHSLIITGDGSLTATGGTLANGENHGINGYSVTVNSGTVTAIGRDAKLYSLGIYGATGVTINGGTVNGIGGTSQNKESLGISTQHSYDPITVNGGTVTAIGSDRGFDFAPDLSGYTDPAVTVNTAATAEGATAWNGTDALGGEDSTFKYVKIAPTTPVTAYNVWVAGVQITDDNKDDVLNDGGTVAFAPETATLTLNNADITGAPVPGYLTYLLGIYSRIDLTLELVGTNIITTSDATRGSYGILEMYENLTVTGDGALAVTAGDAEYSIAISTDAMTMESGTVTATAGKGSNQSAGVYSNGFTMKGGSLTATGGESAESWGINGSFTVTGGTVTAIGQRRGYYNVPDLSGYTAPAVTVNTAATAEGATAWNGTDALGGEDSTFKYVKIAPAAAYVLTGVIFDRNPDAARYADVTAALPTDAPTVTVKLDGTAVDAANYTVSGTTYTLAKEFLANTPAGAHEITFEAESGVYAAMELLVADSAKPANVVVDEAWLINTPNAGYLGADVSARLGGENSSGQGFWGTGLQCAEDFTLTEKTALSAVELYAYHVDSTVDSDFTSLYLRIYDGDPRDASTNLVWGDETTNVLTSTAWTGVYRTNATDFTNSSRPIMKLTAELTDCVLEPGTYWLAFFTDESWGYFVPFAYPDPTQPSSGNALKFDGTWEIMEDLGTELQVALPFLICGTTASQILESIAVTTPPDKTEYAEGESFDPTGMVVTATYGDGSTAEITDYTDYTYEPTGALTPDDTEITITYTENGVTKTVTVSITVRAAYTVTFDPNGGTGVMDPVSVVEGQEYVLPKCTFRAPAGKRFAGWDKGKVGDTIEITGDVVLTARWVTDFSEPTNPVVEPGTHPQPGTHPSEDFVDVDPDEWYVDGIDYVLEHGLMEGVGGNRFDPEGTLTRGMMVTILYRLEGSPGVVGEAPFTDVAPGAWYFNAVLWAAGNDIVLGYGDGRFGPADPLTRQQLAAILYRYAGMKGYDVSKGESGDLSAYTDASQVAEYAVPPMRWVCGEELLRIVGRRLEPAAYATRGLVADMLMRFAELKK